MLLSKYWDRFRLILPSSNLISFFICWKLGSLFTSKFHFTRIRDAPLFLTEFVEWENNFGTFPIRQSWIYTVRTARGWKNEEVFMNFLIFQTPDGLVRILWGFSWEQLSCLFVAKSLESFLGTKQRIVTGGDWATSLWSRHLQICCSWEHIV